MQNQTLMLTAMLISAIDAGDAAAARECIEGGANVNVLVGDDNMTILMLAASRKSAGIVRMIIAAGADVNARSSCGFTPLMCAAIMGERAIVKMLVDAGADVNDRDNNGATALLYAAKLDLAYAVKHLIELGADVHLSDKSKTPP